MSNKITKVFKYKKTKNNGILSGKSVECEVPKYNLKEIIASPDGCAWIEKCFYAKTQKLYREIRLGQNGTDESCLETISSVLNRVTNPFSKKEIDEWFNAIGWTGENKQRIADLIEVLCNDSSIVSNKNKNDLGLWIIDVANSDSDPITNYLIEKCEESSKEIDFEFDGEIVVKPLRLK